MIVEFSMVPVGAGESIGDAIGRVVNVIDASGLPYKVNPMATVVEGGWDEVMALIKACHEEALKTAPRIISRITIDLRPSMPQDRMQEKIKSVEARTGLKLG